MAEIEQSTETLTSPNVSVRATRQGRSLQELLVESLMVSLTMVVLDGHCHVEATAGTVGDVGDERVAELSRLPLSTRDHQSRCLAVSPFLPGFRDVEDFLAQRGVTVSYEAIRQWCQTSVSTTHTSCGTDAVEWATPGIWTNSSARFGDSVTICGGPWTRTVTSSISWSSRDGIDGPQCGSFGSA